MTRLKDSIFSKISICFLLVVSMGFPAITMARVQVLGLTDRATSLSSSGAARSSAAGSNVVSDNFCILSSPKGAVSLTLSNSSGSSPDGQSWYAKNAAGVSMTYVQSLSNVDGSSGMTMSRVGAGPFVVTADRAVEVSTACGSGNVRKSIEPVGGALPASGGPYSDVVTLTATPI